MRKELIPHSRKKRFHEQKKLLRESFEVPGVMDAVLLDVITYASRGRFLYEPGSHTYCKEKVKELRCYMFVGRSMCISPQDRDALRLSIGFTNLYHDHIGLAGSWRF